MILNAALFIGAAAAAWMFPNGFSKIERWCSTMARRRGVAVLAVGILALAARAAVLPIEPIPQPTVHDEFSYLLAADTFAHGRLTNPTHPMWLHFESFHILQKPTYMSKFYPARGLVLAAGQVVLGHPIWGVWLSVGLMCAALCWWLLGKRGPSLGVLARRVVAPLLLVLVPTICAMGYYFWRVTGSPFRIPYLVYQAAYDPVPNFPWHSVPPYPEYHHPVMKDFYLSMQLSCYDEARKHPIASTLQRAADLGTFFLGPLLLMPVGALLLARPWKFFKGLTRPGKALSLLLLCALPLVGIALPVYYFSHYAAPLTGALFALAMLAMRQLRLWHWRNRPVGRLLVRAVPVLAVALLLVDAGVLWAHNGLFPPSQDFGRSAVLAQIKQYKGGQLVIVHYGPNHDTDQEWVYNDADIDAAKVVWARDMGASSNEELIQYFKDRQVWLLEPDESPPKLLSYPPVGGSGVTSP